MKLLAASCRVFRRRRIKLKVERFFVKGCAEILMHKRKDTGYRMLDAGYNKYHSLLIEAQKGVNVFLISA